MNQKSLLLKICMLLSVGAAVGCGSDSPSGSESTTTAANVPAKTEQADKPPRAESPPASAAPVFTVDPCSLITKTDAEAIAGGLVKAPQQDVFSDPAGKVCRYFTTRESDLSRTAQVSVWESENLKASLYEMPAEQYYSRFKAGHKRGVANFEQLQGLGDDAYWWGSNVKVLKGKYVVVVSARGFGAGGADSDVKNKEATIKAAQLALVRLTKE